MMAVERMAPKMVACFCSAGLVRRRVLLVVVVALLACLGGQARAGLRAGMYVYDAGWTWHSINEPVSEEVQFGDPPMDELWDEAWFVALPPDADGPEDWVSLFISPGMWPERMVSDCLRTHLYADGVWEVWVVYGRGGAGGGGAGGKCCSYEPPCAGLATCLFGVQTLTEPRIDFPEGFPPDLGIPDYEYSEPAGISFEARNMRVTSMTAEGSRATVLDPFMSLSPDDSIPTTISTAVADGLEIPDEDDVNCVTLATSLGAGASSWSSNNSPDSPAPETWSGTMPATQAAGLYYLDADPILDVDQGDTTCYISNTHTAVVTNLTLVDLVPAEDGRHKLSATVSVTGTTGKAITDTRYVLMRTFDDALEELTPLDNYDLLLTGTANARTVTFGPVDLWDGQQFVLAAAYKVEDDVDTHSLAQKWCVPGKMQLGTLSPVTVRSVEFLEDIQMYWPYAGGIQALGDPEPEWTSYDVDQSWFHDLPYCDPPDPDPYVAPKREPAAYVRPSEATRANNIPLKVVLQGPPNASVRLQAMGDLGGVPTTPANGYASFDANGRVELTVHTAQDVTDAVDTMRASFLWLADTGQGWRSAGGTSHKVYVTLAERRTPSQAEFEHLFRFSCAWAKGGTTEDEVFDADVSVAEGTDIWGGIATLNIESDTDDALNYYGSDATGVTTTWGLLVYHDGQCLSWASLLQDLAAVHGIAAPICRLELIPPRLEFQVGRADGSEIDGQGEGMPAARRFARHFVVTKPDEGDPGVPDDYRGDIHDPSYGAQLSAVGQTALLALDEVVRVYEIDNVHQFRYPPPLDWQDDLVERELEPGPL